MYKVIMLNDDRTPMDFVVRVLMKTFAMGRVKAEKIMLRIHHKGRGVCGIFVREIAETKAAEVVRISQDNSHSLKCIIEKTNSTKKDAE